MRAVQQRLEMRRVCTMRESAAPHARCRDRQGAAKSAVLRQRVARRKEKSEAAVVLRVPRAQARRHHDSRCHAAIF